MYACLDLVFSALKAILKPYATTLDVKFESDSELYIDTRHIQTNQKPLFFGAVQIRKRYVSYHLMLVYVEPKLLEDIPSELKTRMQGKSCFNFSRIDGELFKELAVLTERSYTAYKDRGFV
jgi:hypothetical protein